MITIHIPMYAYTHMQACTHTHTSNTIYLHTKSPW